MKRSILSCLVVVGLVGLFSLPGCSGSTGINRGGELTGKVTIDGKAVTGGTVLVASNDDRYAVSGSINEYGTYVVKEPPLGPCKVAVRTLHLRGSVRPKDSGRQGKGGVGSAGMVLPDPQVEGLTYVAIPSKYEEIKSTDLTVGVASGKQEHDLPLTSK